MTADKTTNTTNTTTREIKVNTLARVEGEGSLEIKIEEGKIRHLALRIFEAPRYFEALLQGRQYSEVPDITSRICGICPVAYQMSSVHAIERIFQSDVGAEIKALRRLLYAGEWIESHSLHIYLLHAPDFLGYPSGIHLSADAPDTVKQGLELKKIGNQVMQVIGGREIHPINVKVGGFYKNPSKADIQSLEEPLERALELAKNTLDFVGTLKIPEFERDYKFVALRHESEYPLNEGKLATSTGLLLDAEEYADHFTEIHEAHSNALHSVCDGQSYLVGPLARYSLNFDRLSPWIQEAALKAGLQKTCNNPFESIKVRAVELLFACEEALKLVREYQEPEEVAIKVKAGASSWITEAPRGILYHRYELDEDGFVQSANIIPPTSQNLRTIEEDLKGVIEKNLDLDTEKLKLLCEQAIRNYDPCISCATHFLDLKIIGR